MLDFGYDGRYEGQVLNGEAHGIGRLEVSGQVTEGSFTSRFGWNAYSSGFGRQLFRANQVQQEVFGLVSGQAFSGSGFRKSSIPGHSGFYENNKLSKQFEFQF